MWATGSVGLCCFWWCVDWFRLPFYFGIGLTGLRVCGIWGIGEKLTFEAVWVVWNKGANGTEADPLTLLQPYIIIMILHSTALEQTDRQTIQKQSRSIHNRQQTADNGPNHCCHLSSHNGMPAPNWNRPGPPAYSLHPRALKIFRQKYNYQKSAQFLVQFLIYKY